MYDTYDDWPEAMLTPMQVNMSTEFDPDLHRWFFYDENKDKRVYSGHGGWHFDPVDGAWSLNGHPID